MNIDPNANRPKLKKIKRPINRTMPIGNAQTQSQTQPQPQPQPSNNISSGNVTPQANNQAQQSIATYQQQTPNAGSLSNYYENSANFTERTEQNASSMPKFIGDEDNYDDQYYSDIPEWLNTKVFVGVVIACLIVGILFGKIFFTQSTVVRNGLQGVVVNSEVPRGRARCGIAERSQGCVLYIMNPQRQELVAKDFYELASQVTGRQRFMIETGNMRYANTKIKPGDIVQLNIPPL